MGKLYLLGAGGVGREIYSYLKADNFIYSNYELCGFLSDYPNDLTNYNVSHKIIDKILSKEVKPNDAVIIAVADCSLKKKLYNYYDAIGCEIISYIHPTAYIGDNIKIGRGCVIFPYSTLTTDIVIGNAVTINIHTSIGHDAKIEDFCTLSCHCDITGYVYLQHSVFMGSHSLIIPRINVGSNAVVGAGAVIIEHVDSCATMVGNPAKKINKN